MIRRGYQRWLVKRDSIAFRVLLALRVPLYPARVDTDCVSWAQIGRQ